jgi:hypothetical protein
MDVPWQSLNCVPGNGLSIADFNLTHSYLWRSRMILASYAWRLLICVCLCVFGGGGGESACQSASPRHCYIPSAERFRGLHPWA